MNIYDYITSILQEDKIIKKNYHFYRTENRINNLHLQTTFLFINNKSAIVRVTFSNEQLDNFCRNKSYICINNDGEKLLVNK